MLGQRLHAQTFDLIKTIRELWMKTVDGDLTFQQIRILLFISHGKTQTMMAEAMLVTPAAISKMIDTLVQKGLVDRKPGEDRRCQSLSFTPAGKKVFAKFIKNVEGKLDQEVSRLSSQEQKQLDQGLAVMGKLISMMDEV